MIHLARRRRIAALIVLGLSMQIAAQTPLATSSEVLSRPLLNSERIAQEFGSYDIEVLESDASVRVSNLYSLQQGKIICRTFAVVRYPHEIEGVFSVEQRAVLSGQSIGAVFAQHGWTIEKINRYFGVLPSTKRVAGLMGDISPQPLAVHIYDLVVSRESASLTYATIAEVHHPDYLTVVELQEIYGVAAASITGGGGGEEPMLALTREKMN